MKLQVLLLATFTIGCRAATDKSPSSGDGDDDSTQSVSSESQEDSGEAWYDYDADDGGSGSGGDDDGKEDDGKEDDGKEDGGDGGDYEIEPCPDDFDPDAPCEGTWETGAMCYEGETIWYCEGGRWTNK